MSLPSIRKTLLMRCGLGIGALLSLLSAGVYLLVSQGLYRELDESIAQTAALLANEVEYEDYRITFEWQEGIGTNRALTEDGLFQFWEEKTGNTTRSPGLQPHDLPRFTGINGEPLLRNIVLADGHRGRAIGLRVFPFVVPAEMEKMKSSGAMVDPKSLPLVLVVARDAEAVNHTLDRLRWVLVCGSLLTLALGFLIIHRIVRVSLLPIEDMSEQMEERAEHQLDSALVVPEELPMELSGLARSFDSLLARVSAIRQRERDFIRHAAHEMRTPVAGLRATTELALSRTRTADEYRDHLITCQNTAAELGELIKRLSALARIGQSGEVAKHEIIDLNTLLEHCIEPYQGLLDERGLTFSISFITERIRTLGDPSLSRIILNNLLDNALSYTPPGGMIRIVLGETVDRAILRISNPTLTPPENPAQWFEPLFRSNPSRHDADSHLGIGLTLSLDAANAMGWSLSANITDEGWIEFMLGMPKVFPNR